MVMMIEQISVQVASKLTMAPAGHDGKLWTVGEGAAPPPHTVPVNVAVEAALVPAAAMPPILTPAVVTLTTCVLLTWTEGSKP